MRNKKLLIILLFAMMVVTLSLGEFPAYADTAEAPVTLTKKAEENKEEEAAPNTADTMPLAHVYIMMVSAVSAGCIVLRKFKNP